MDRRIRSSSMIRNQVRKSSRRAGPCHLAQGEGTYLGSWPICLEDDHLPGKTDCIMRTIGRGDLESSTSQVQRFGNCLGNFLKLRSFCPGRGHCRVSVTENFSGQRMRQTSPQEDHIAEAGTTLNIHRSPRLLTQITELNASIPI